MRKIFTLAFFLTSITSFAQLEAGLSYAGSVPLKGMKENISFVHNAIFDARYRFDHGNSKLWAGVQAWFGNYASKTIEQMYQFRDGSSTLANVTFSSNIMSMVAVGGFDLVSKDKAVIPYITAKGGYSTYATQIYIADPHDDNSCKPLKKKNVYHDNQWIAGYGVGMKIRADKIFKKADRTWWIDLSVGRTGGGKINYLNVKHIEHDPSTNPDPKDGFNVQFVNVTTNEIHDHQVTKVLTSSISLLDCKLGVVFPIGFRR